jgi:hypothetical protein
MSENRDSKPDQGGPRVVMVEGGPWVPLRAYEEAVDYVNHNATQRKLAEGEVDRLRAENETLKADVVRVVLDKQKVATKLRRAAADMLDARAQLTVGMKAGVADARKILAEGIESARTADEEGQS